MKKTFFGVYIHIPYCSRICPYCDFNAYAVRSIPEDRYQQAVVQEFESTINQLSIASLVVESIYFGGGTPSIFSAGSIQNILNTFKPFFSENKEIEITLEANPGEINLPKLEEFRSAGINRVSFGAQSFQDSTLKTLGRTHNASDIEEAVSFARKAGFENINIDLIFSVPGQTEQMLKNDLQKLEELRPDHVSLYELTIEKATPFFQAVETGTLVPLDEEVALSMHRCIDQTLEDAGYYRYEISNYAKPNRESIHNLRYWQRQPYIGLGSGAHSFLQFPSKEIRRENIRDPEQYMSAIEAKSSPVAWEETLTAENILHEKIMLGLRTTQGVSMNLFPDSYEPIISDLLTREILEKEGKSLRLSKKGVFVADSVIRELFNV